jgi:hypothetical protein
LRSIIGVGDGAGAQAVADGEADILGGHDVAEGVPMGAEEIFTTGDGAFPNPAARATSISGRQVLAQQRLIIGSRRKEGRERRLSLRRAGGFGGAALERVADEI